MPNQHDTAAPSKRSVVTIPPACMQAGGNYIHGTQRKNHGRKRRFGIAGILNVAATNLVLQALLASGTTSIFLATLISQGVNTCLGYLIYGKIVFQAKGLRSKRAILKYLCLMAGLWLLNWSTIGAGTKAGFNKNITAATMVPALAIASYTAQKSWVFKQ